MSSIAKTLLDPNNIGMSEADYGGFASTGNKLKYGLLAQLLMEPIRKAAGFVNAASDYSNEQFPMQSGVTEQSTDYDPGRVASSFGAETAMNLVGAPSGAGGLGSGARIRAYHGSPHDFDKFDMSKIGTGEGAQAYGHGLYFAENEGVARNYRDALSNSTWTVGGKPYDAKNPDHLASAFVNEFGSPDGALVGLRKAIAQDEKINADWARLAVAQKEDAIRRISSGKLETLVDTPHGRMYEVNINAQPDQFLDWDKYADPRVRQQISGALKDTKIDPLHEYATAMLDSDYPLKGSEIYRDIAARGSWGSPIENAKPVATDILRSGDIPGIKYLDQGSRGIPQTWTLRHPQGGLSDYPTEQLAEAALAKNPEMTLIPPKQQSSNYVLFDAQLVEILRKYGLLGPVAGTAIAGADQTQQ